MEKQNLAKKDIKDVLKILSKEIAQYKKLLVKKFNEIGIYENFGQDEVRELKDKYSFIYSFYPNQRQLDDLINSFDNWCMNYGG